MDELVSSGGRVGASPLLPLLSPVFCCYHLWLRTGVLTFSRNSTLAEHGAPLLEEIAPKDFAYHARPEACDCFPTLSDL